MSILPSNPPPSSEAFLAVAKALRDILPTADAMAGAPRSASQPLQKFTIALNDILRPRMLEFARPVGWQYLIAESKAIAVADVHSLVDGKFEAGAITTGDFPLRLQLATELADRTYGSDPKVYEARILEVPGLYFVALWLHGASDDKFFPVLDGTSTSEIGEEPDFLSRLVQRANSKAIQR